MKVLIKDNNKTRISIWIPLFVLKSNFKRVSGKSSNIIVHGIPINKEKNIACLIFLLIYLKLPIT